MKPLHALEFVALAALWGASFLWMRLSAAEFGPVALIAVRVGGAALLLLPLLHWRGESAALRRHWRALAVVGVTNSALPFLCFAFAALSITAGLSSIFNAAAPLFAALIARVGYGERLAPARSAGLAIGFGGVLWTAWGGAGVKASGAAWAIAACLGAAVCYGWSPNYSKSRLAGVPPLAIAAGSQMAAAIALLVPAWLTWPATTPSALAWASAAMLAFFSTGLAYVSYFRLVERTGPTNAIAVTFLIPPFAMAWGWIFLGEGISLAMLVGCLVILLGTALATGVLRAPRPRTAAADIGRAADTIATGRR